MLAQASIALGNICPYTEYGSWPCVPITVPAIIRCGNSVGYLMRMSINRVLPQMEALFEDQELTFSQWTTLVALHDGRITTAGDLAHNICHDAGSLTRLIDQMEKRGLVTPPAQPNRPALRDPGADAARPRSGGSAGAPGDGFLEQAAVRLFAMPKWIP